MRVQAAQALRLDTLPGLLLAEPFGIIKAGSQMISTGAASRSRRLSSPAHEHVAGWKPPQFFRLKRTLLAVAATLVSFNIWTGGPLFAVWVGSRFEGWVGARAPSTGVSMKSIVVVVVVLAVLEITLVIALAHLSAMYDKLTGRPHEARRTSPWLRSLRGEREESTRKKYGISAIERIAVISVVACVLAFEVWFFFFTGDSLPKS
jgi:hypothetical protein